MRVFIDSGGFLAVMDRDDPLHPAARDISARLESIRSQLYTSNYIVDETCTLVRARTRHSLAAQFLRSLTWIIREAASCVETAPSPCPSPAVGRGDEELCPSPGYPLGVGEGGGEGVSGIRE